jgi:hypothetical protein
MLSVASSFRDISAVVVLMHLDLFLLVQKLFVEFPITP